MTDPAKKITIGGTSIILPSTARVVVLFNNASVQNKTFEENGVDYIVPVAKKLWILKVKSNDQSAGGALSYYKHTVVDTAGGTLIAYTYLNATATIFDFDQFVSVEAGKYINLTVDDTNGFHWIYGVELDA